MDAKIKKLMDVLHISEAEALEVMADDKRIDRGEKLFELAPELEKGAKKARQADRKPQEKKAPRQRKENSDKRYLINLLKEAIGPNADSEVEVTNVERELVFSYSGVKYKIILSAPRS